MNNSYRAFAVCLAATLLSACNGSGGTTGSGQVSPVSVLPAAHGGAAAPATGYTVVDLGAGPNGKDAYGYAQNSAAEAGAYYDHSISCGKDCSAKVYYPLAWTGSSHQPTVLLPQNYVEGWAYGAGGSLIVGTLITNDGGYFGFNHAALWKGSTRRFTDLNPSGSCGSCSPGSNAYGASGTSIVGSGGSPLHALLWRTSNLSAPVDLNPGGYAYSEAYAVSGTAQVGYAYSNTTSTKHAILWASTPGSATDLTPSTISSAYATALSGSSEVGCGTPASTSGSHALLWHGTAASMKDLQPAGFTDSCARAVHGKLQVGYGHTSGNVLHALLWSGSAKSVVDLQQYLPGTFTSSEAYAIDTAGDILGSAYSTSTASWHAVLWQP